MYLKLSKDSNINNNTLCFYDLNAKLNYTLVIKTVCTCQAISGKTNRLPAKSSG